MVGESLHVNRYIFSFSLGVSTLIAYVIVAGIASAVGAVILSRLFQEFELSAVNEDFARHVSITCFPLNKTVNLGSTACQSTSPPSTANTAPGTAYLCIVYSPANASVRIFVAGGDEYLVRAYGMCTAVVYGKPIYAVVQYALSTRVVEVKLR